MLFIGKADILFLPCPIKYLIGLDCPGCGFQRSLFALLTGNLAESFQLYPPTIPFLLAFIAGILAWKFKLNQNSNWLKGLYFFTGFVMFANYFYKIILHQL